MAAPWLRSSARLFAALRLPRGRRSLHEWAPPRDVLLFEHKRGRFFVALGLFCAGQGVFWTSLAIAAVARPSSPAQPSSDADLPDHNPRNWRSLLWSYGLAIGSGAVGKAWAAFSLREWGG